MDKFLTWLTAHLPAREIRGDRGEPYLERYALCGRLGVYLHRFLASDPARGLHDHPWRWSVSVVLAGGYREVRPGRIRRLRPGAVNYIRGTDFHRILIKPGVAVWSIFLHGPRVKGWGFLRGGVYHPHTESETSANPNWWRTAPRGRDLRAARARA